MLGISAEFQTQLSIGVFRCPWFIEVDRRPTALHALVEMAADAGHNLVEQSGL